MPIVRLFRACVIITIASACLSGTALGGKGGNKGGGGDTTPPTGTLYLAEGVGSSSSEPRIRSLNPDGTGLADALPPGTPLDTLAIPSNGSYNGRRIFLVKYLIDPSSSRAELWALRANADGSVSRLQLTNMNVDLQIDLFYSLPRWGNTTSNEVTLLDDFVSIQVLGTLSGVDFSAVVRLPMTAAEISAAMDGSIAWTPATENDAEFILTSVVSDGVIADHSWSPDGGRVAYTFQDRQTVTRPESLYVYDLATGTDSPRLLGGAPYDNLGSLSWTPDGSRLAIAGYYLSIGNRILSGIFTLMVDGTDLRLILSESTTKRFAYPQWSPDGRFIASQLATKVKVKGLTVWQHDVVRVNADGSNQVNLTENLEGFNRTLHVELRGWR